MWFPVIPFYCYDCLFVLVVDTVGISNLASNLAFDHNLIICQFLTYLSILAFLQ